MNVQSQDNHFCGSCVVCAKWHEDGQVDRRAYEARLNVRFRSCFANAPKTESCQYVRHENMR